MLHYAREDTHYLLYVYDKLRNELLSRGNAQHNLLHAVYTRSRDVCLQRYERPVYSRESAIALYRKHQRPLNPTQLAVYYALHEWRDAMARREDESTNYILPNHMVRKW